MANTRAIESKLHSFIQSLSIEQRQELSQLLLKENRQEESASVSVASEEQSAVLEEVSSRHDDSNKATMTPESNPADNQQKEEKKELRENNQTLSLEETRAQEIFSLDIEKRKSFHVMASAESDQADLVEPLDEEQQQEKKFFSIFEAAEAGNIKAIEKCLAQGATLTEKDRGRGGVTALLLAAWQGHTQTVQWLLDRGATLTEQNQFGKTALLLAAWQGRTQTVQLLLERGATLTEKDKNGMTALLLAAWQGRTQTVQLLLERGAMLIEENNAGKTALLLAKEEHHASLHHWLILYEAVKFKKIDSQLHALKSVLAYKEQYLFFSLKSELHYLDYYKANNKEELYLCSARFLLSLPCELLLTHPKLTELERQELKSLLVTQYEKALQEKEGSMHFVFSAQCYWELYKLQILLAYLKEKEQHIPRVPLTHLIISRSVWPTEESWLIFIKALPSFSLRSLELTNCQLKDRALLSLAPILLQIPTLTTCVLDRNHMSYSGFRDFIKIISHHPELRQLSLRENRIEQADKKQLDRDVGAVLREAREQNPFLQPIDITGNYLMSKGHNPTQLNVLRLLLRKTGLSVQEFSQAEWLRERDSARADHTVLCLQVNEEGRDFDVPVDVMGALTTYRDELRLGSDAKTFKDLQMSIAAALRYYPHLKAVRLSEIEAHAIKEQKRVCKSLLFYHKAAPLKSYLQCDSHSLLHTQKLEQTACLLDPQQSVTPREWNVYFLAKRGSDMMEIIKDRVIKEHAMLGWEGVYSYGQRVIKMAELTVETRISALGVLTTKQLVISYFPLEIERIDSFRKHYIFATFRASKDKVKEMERAIDSEVGDLPGKYKKILGSSGSEVSGGQLSPEDQEKVTTNCQKWALEKLERCLDLPERTLQREMAVRPSATALALQALPTALKKERHGQGEELEVKEAPQEESRCVLM